MKPSELLGAAATVDCYLLRELPTAYDVATWSVSWGPVPIRLERDLSENGSHAYKGECNLGGPDLTIYAAAFGLAVDGLGLAFGWLTRGRGEPVLQISAAATLSVSARFASRW